MYDVDNTDAEMTWTCYGEIELIVNIDVNRVATITIPYPDWYGSETITFRATDPHGSWDEDPVTFYNVTPVNDPPIITTFDNITAYEDILYIVDYEAIDADFDTLTWSMTSNAGFLLLDTITGILSGIPENSHVGSYYVNVSVDDGNGAYDFSNFTLLVLNTNDPPHAPFDPSPYDGETGMNLSPILKVNVSDPDGDLLNVSFYDASDDSFIGIDVGVSNGDVAVFVWNGLSYSSTYSWYAVANDSEFTNKSITWSFSTKSAPKAPPKSVSNNPPIANASKSEKFGFIGETITFDASLSFDIDGFITDYKWNFKDGTIKFGKITTHNFSTSGTYHVSLIVTDNNGATDEDIIKVVILKANNPPSKPTIDGPINGHKNTSYDFTALSLDPDKDYLQYTFDWGDGKTTITEFLSNGTIALRTHKWANYGEYIVSVKAFDNETLSGTNNLTILIDVLPIRDVIVGYLTDLDSDGTYDIFNNTNTGKHTVVEKDNTSYLIDIDGNDKWDYAYNMVTGILVPYHEFVINKYHKIYLEEIETPGFEVISVLAMIAIVLILLKRKR